MIVLAGCCAVVLILGCGAGPKVPDDPLERYGWRATTANEATVTAAVDLANQLLQDDVGCQLALGNSPVDSGKKRIPVYLVSQRNLARTERIFVPPGEKFVVVNSINTVAYLNDLSSEKDGIPLLAVMLLHELGHIVHGDSGSLGSEEDFSVQLLNVKETPEKSQELRADRFAAHQIKLAMQPGQPMPRFMASMKVGPALTMASFNASTRQQLQFFGDQNGERHMDRGYSHPNFALRLLIILHEITDDASTKKNIEQILIEREPKAPNVLFQQPALPEADSNK